MIIDYIKSMFGTGNILDENTQAYINTLSTEIAYKTLAIETCSSLIANTISSCEFKTYDKMTEVKKNNYYALNVQPNSNENAQEFWRKAIYKLLTKNECLIVVVDGQYHVADSFSHDEKALVEDYYKDVVVRGYALNEPFRENQVIYLKLNNKDISKVLNSVYDDYSKLISSAKKGFKKSQGHKGIVKMESMTTVNPMEQEKRENLFKTQFKKWFEAEEAVLPLGKGMDFIDKTVVTTKSSDDIRKLIDDVFMYVCSAYHVPHMMAMGSVAGLHDLIDSYIMFAIKPVVMLLENELNRKVYKKHEFLEGSFIKINTKKIKLVDIKTLATTTDLFLRNGSYCINDNRDLLDEMPIDADWAKEHYITKNYQTILGGADNE